MPTKKQPVENVIDKDKPRKFYQKINSKKTTGVLLILILLGGILYLGRSLFVAAIVNGKPITRYTLVRDLETQGGKATLNNLIEKSLIFQEAAKSGINIDKVTIDAEIKKIEDNLKTQNLSLDDALKARSLTREGLSDQIKIQKTVEAILLPKITVADEELKTYFDQNKSLFAQGAKFEDLKDQIKEQVQSQKLSEEYQKWITDLKAKAKINYFVNF
jgi:parvulin-like peptidyl-prolyl isomerase